MMYRSALCALAVPLLRAHPCEQEIATACPDTPMEEIGDCLKDETQHEKPTEISSECTDFMALNSACKEDISTHCDDAFFSDDTAPCLSKWTDQEQIGSKCARVMQWAIAQPEDEEQEDGPTDELGMSDADRAEKAEWQKNRKAIREEAIGRMKMKEIDRKKEEDRVALLKFKEDDPEGYAEMIRQQEEEKRQQAEFKRQERIRAAAYQRKFNDEEVETAQPKKKKGSFMKSAKWFVLGALKVGVFVAILGGIAYVVKAAGSGGAAKRGGGSGKGSKKRR